jgi:hypothetical protein
MKVFGKGARKPFFKKVFSQNRTNIQKGFLAREKLPYKSPAKTK